ncbi:MAG TPA: hypothetical protein VK195_15385 [Burkholderiaceae bacterium]|nr:hypothetical protein [Burkholderiaceae bacterium]
MSELNVNPEDIEFGAPSARRRLIQRRLPSRASAINEYQVAMLIGCARLLCGAALKRFEVPDASRLREVDHEAFVELLEYDLFIKGAYACGFVCRDISLDINLELINSAPSAYVREWGLYEIRAYFHNLLRSERWGFGYSSPILTAMRSGALMSVVDRLADDATLYEDISDVAS